MLIVCRPASGSSGSSAQTASRACVVMLAVGTSVRTTTFIVRGMEPAAAGLTANGISEAAGDSTP